MVAFAFWNSADMRLLAPDSSAPATATCGSVDTERVEPSVDSALGVDSTRSKL